MEMVAYILNINHAYLGRRKVDAEGLLPVRHQLKDGKTLLSSHTLTWTINGIFLQSLYKKNTRYNIVDLFEQQCINHLKKMPSDQREIVRVDPDDAEVGVIGVLASHLLQDFQEFKTI